MKAIATKRFVHGAISAAAGQPVTGAEGMIRELEAAGLVTVEQKQAEKPENKMAEPKNKRKAKSDEPDNA